MTINVIAVLVFALPLRLWAQPLACEKLIPQHGAFKTVTEGASTHTFDSAKSWFCSDSFLHYASSQKDKGSVDIPIPDLPIGSSFDFNNKQDLLARQKFCSTSNSQFTSDQISSLFIQEGDPTLVNAFVSCIKTINTDLIQVSTESHSTGTFDVKIGSKGYPGKAPTILSVYAETGARALMVKQFATKTPIPFTTDGKSPLVGSYAFLTDASEAIVLVRTSIGDKAVVADRCPTGKAGAWKVVKDIPHMTVVPTTEFQQSFEVPQAGCHPHCNGGGDSRAYNFAAPGGETLANPRISCENGRAECPLDAENATLVDDHTVRATVVSRTLGLQFTVYADAFTTQEVTSRDAIENGDIAYDKEFSVTVPNDGNPELDIDSPLGTLTITPNQLATGGLPSWLNVEDPQPNPIGTIYTFNLRSPSCAAK